jgi:hypothetical protein
VGELTAAEWRELRIELEPGMGAAEAEVKSLRKQLVESGEGVRGPILKGAALEKLARKNRRQRVHSAP